MRIEIFAILWRENCEKFVQTRFNHSLIDQARIFIRNKFLKLGVCTEVWELDIGILLRIFLDDFSCKLEFLNEFSCNFPP